MFVLKVFSDGGKSVFVNALVKVTGSVTDVFCIAQITYIVINNALLIDFLIDFGSCTLRSSPILRLLNSGCSVREMFFNYVR